jgi:hypothetical protein
MVRRARDRSEPRARDATARRRRDRCRKMKIEDLDERAVMTND